MQNGWVTTVYNSVAAARTIKHETLLDQLTEPEVLMWGNERRQKRFPLSIERQAEVVQERWASPFSTVFLLMFCIFFPSTYRAYNNTQRKDVNLYILWVTYSAVCVGRGLTPIENVTVTHGHALKHSMHCGGVVFWSVEAVCQRTNWSVCLFYNALLPCRAHWLKSIETNRDNTDKTLMYFIFSHRLIEINISNYFLRW